MVDEYWRRGYVHNHIMYIINVHDMIARSSRIGKQAFAYPTQNSIRSLVFF